MRDAARRRLRPPDFEYGHKQTSGAYGCAIIGGYIVRDRSLGDLYGRYLYADFCTADIRSFAPSNPAGSDRSENLLVGEPTSFGEDSCGRIYVMGRGGAVERFVGATPAKCVRLVDSRVTIKARSRTVKRGAKALLSVRVFPCASRAGERVLLYQGSKRRGGARLNRNCVARMAAAGREPGGLPGEDPGRRTAPGGGLAAADGTRSGLSGAVAKLIYAAICSLDGYVEDADGNFDWAAPDEEVHAFVNDLERPIGTYLYGRRMYETMVFWEAGGSDPEEAPVMRDFAAIWRAADKVVYSRTLAAPSSARPGSSASSTPRRSAG